MVLRMRSGFGLDPVAPSPELQRRPEPDYTKKFFTGGAPTRSARNLVS